MAKEKQNGSSKKGRVTSVIGLFFCLIFGFMLVCNLYIIIAGTLNPKKPPALFGITPMVVLSGSMSGNAEDHIEVGDLIFVGKANPQELKVGDVIAFMEKDSTSVVTHRIVAETKTENGEKAWITKGDANNVEDANPVTSDRLVGVYLNRIPKVGDFAMFLQKPLGMIIFIGVPLLSFIIYDIIRRQKYADKENARTAELEAELEKLRSQVKKDEPDDSAE